MLRSSLFTASAFALMAGASAQSTPATDSAVKITGPVKYAGSFHVPTQTWTRGQTVVSNFGATDNLYSNTAGSGYYYGTVAPDGLAPLGNVLDEGAIPSTSDPRPFTTGPGRDASQVETVTIGYCDFDATTGVAGWTLDFYNTYDRCTYPPDPAQLAGTAAISAAPSNGCWILDITGLDFTIQHDGEGTNDGDLALDGFGIDWSYTGTGVASAGLIITGDPANTDTGYLVGANPTTGSNTYYGEVGGCPGFGSGYENGDLYWVEDPTAGAGGLPAGSACYWFGGYNNTGSACGGPITGLYGGFYIEVSGGDAGPGDISDPGCTNNPNSTGVPGTIRVTGSPIALDNDAVLEAGSLPLNQFGIFAAGRDPIAPGTINSGNGTLCINPATGGGLGRFAGPGQIKNSGATGIITLDTNASEWDVSMIPTSTGTYAAVAGITSYFQGWYRDPSVGAGYNFTDSCSVTWQ